MFTTDAVGESTEGYAGEEAEETGPGPVHTGLGLAEAILAYHGGDDEGAVDHESGPESQVEQSQPDQQGTVAALFSGYQLVRGGRCWPAERFQSHLGRMVTHQPGCQKRNDQGDDSQQQPSGPPAVCTKAAVKGRHQHAGQHDGGTVSGDHQPGGFSALIAAEPVTDQGHGGDVGEAGAHADQKVEGQRDQKTMAEAEGAQRQGDQRQAGADHGPWSEAFDQTGRQYD